MKSSNKILTANLVNQIGKRYIAVDVITASNTIKIQLKNNPKTNQTFRNALKQQKKLNLQN